MVVKKHGSSSEVKEFVEEMVVRRELSDNFCYYNDNYDNLVIFTHGMKPAYFVILWKSTGTINIKLDITTSPKIISLFKGKRML